MIPFGNETVTLIKRNEITENGRKKTVYSKHILTGCSWKQTERWIQYDTEKRLSYGVTCRVPAGQAAPAADDYLFLGTIKEEIITTADIRAAMAAHKGRAIQITYVADNVRNGFPMPHYACTGG